MNQPIYRINGIERRKLKKELSELKSFLKNYFHYHQLDKDMVSFYGESEQYPMSDNEAEKRYIEILSEVKELEERLSVKL
jgi:hypothetical protein